MANLNRVLLIGNLTRDPELRYTPGGAPVTSFGLAVNTTIPRADGQAKEEVCFVRIVVWGKQAESCKQYLSKGRPVCVEGRLVYRSWQQEGKTRSTLEVKADRVQFLGGRREEAPAAAAAEPMPVEDAVGELVGEGVADRAPEALLGAKPSIGGEEMPRTAGGAADEEPPF